MLNLYTALDATFPILGGYQVWADVWVREGWRVQEHIGAGTCRLLDSCGRIQRKGSAAACIEAGMALAPMPTASHAVVILHGLGRTRRCMRPMAHALATAGFRVADITYPSLMRGITDHAAQVDRVLLGLEGAQTVSFVGHSLGCLVIRACLAGVRPWNGALRPTRAVLIGGPNNGAAFADALKNFSPFRTTGPSGLACTTGMAHTVPPMAADVAFGLIAGGTGKSGYNPFLNGDNDGIVSVRESRLGGAADFLLLPSFHTFIMAHPAAIAATARFLHTGGFATP